MLSSSLVQVTCIKQKNTFLNMGEEIEFYQEQHLVHIVIQTYVKYKIFQYFLDEFLYSKAITSVDICYEIQRITAKEIHGYY